MDLTIPIEDPSRRGALYGTADRNLRVIRRAFDVRISARDNTIRLSGPSGAVQMAANVIEDLQRSLRLRPDIDEESVQESIRQARHNGTARPKGALDVFLKSVTIAPKGEGQQRYVDAILENDLTFCLGPAGTGKTYLAVAVAVYATVQDRPPRG